MYRILSLLVILLISCTKDQISCADLKSEIKIEYVDRVIERFVDSYNLQRIREAIFVSENMSNFHNSSDEQLFSRNRIAKDLKIFEKTIKGAGEDYCIVDASIVKDNYVNIVCYFENYDYKIGELKPLDTSKFVKHYTQNIDDLRFEIDITETSPRYTVMYRTEEYRNVYDLYFQNGR